MNEVSYNVGLASPDGCRLPSASWTPVGRIRFATNPAGGIADLRWNDATIFPPTFVGEELNRQLFAAAEGSYEDLVFDTDVAFPCPPATSFDASCPPGYHALGGPRLGFTGTPQLGTTFTIGAANLTGNSICALLVGDRTAPLPLSTIGSTVPRSALCLAPFTSFPCSGTSTARVPFAIPATVGLCGVTLDSQWVDYVGRGTDFGTSESLRWTIGS